MSKIAFVNIPAYGHVNPTLPVAKALVERGEQVMYYNADEFRDVIAPTGATFRAYPPSSLSAEAIATAMQSGNLINATNLLLTATDELLPFVADDLGRERPDLVVFDSTAVWGRMAATMGKLKAAGSITTFVFGFAQARLSPLDAAIMVGRFLPKVPGIIVKRSKLIRRFGKDAYPAGPTLFPVRGELNLVFTARALQPDMPLIDQTFHFVGPSINPQTRQDDFPLEALSDAPLVYVSLGTVHAAKPEFYRALFERFADYPAQFVISAGKRFDISQLGTIPARFVVRPTVPQLALLERAAAFVTHAGINSVHEAMYHGVPIVALPQQVEQLMNAIVVADHGAGIVLRQQLRGGEIPVDALRPALDAVLHEPAYRDSARRVQQMLRATGGYAEAAALLQTYAAAGL